MTEEVHEQVVIVGDRPAEIAARVAGTVTYTPLYPPLVDFVLRLADDAMILTQRLMEWSYQAPVLEEDIALSNTALDLLGQARMLYTYAGSLMEPVRTQDDLAYWRSGAQFRCAHIVQIENGDFAETVARNLVFALYQQGLYGALRSSTDPTVAAIAGKAAKEVAYHVEHFATWVLRLGDGTEESHRRMQQGIDRIWPYVAELFDADAGVVPLIGGRTDELLRPLIERGVCPQMTGLYDEWLAAMTAIIETAACTVPTTKWHARAGRRGVHTAHLDRILVEMQSVARAHPGARW